MANIIRELPSAPDRRALSSSLAAAGNRERKSAGRGPRFARATIGFWLGGVILGTVGCIFGVCMPYRHPVAVVLSAVWWGIYLGCFGGSVGALLSLWTTRTPAVPSQGSMDAGQLPSGVDRPAVPDGSSDSLSGARRDVTS